MENYNKMYCEKNAHQIFKKYLWCTYKKKASNQAIVGELGRFPMHIDVIKSCFKYLQRIINSPVHSLLRNAVHEKMYYMTRTKAVGSVIFKLDIQCPLNDKNIVTIVTNKLYNSNCVIQSQSMQTNNLVNYEHIPHLRPDFVEKNTSQ
jgi:hypothetical protein